MFGYPTKRKKTNTDDKELDFAGIHFRQKPRTNLYVPEFYTYSRYRQKLEQFRKGKRVPELQIKRDWIPIILNLIGILVVGTYTVYARRQWIASHDILPKIQGQIDAAKHANDIAQQANSNTINLFASSERAWVGLGPIDVSQALAHDKPLKLRAQVLNSGKTPAIQVQPHYALSPWTQFFPGWMPNEPLRDVAPQLAPCYAPKPSWDSSLGGTIVLPGATNLSIDLQTSAAITNETVDAIQNFDTPDPKALEAIPTYLLFAGCINYFDEFHNSHRTNFCEMWNPKGSGPNGTFVSCLDGNSAD